MFLKCILCFLGLIRVIILFSAVRSKGPPVSNPGVSTEASLVAAPSEVNYLPNPSQMNYIPQQINSSQRWYSVRIFSAIFPHGAIIGCFHFINWWFFSAFCRSFRELSVNKPIITQVSSDKVCYCSCALPLQHFILSLILTFSYIFEVRNCLPTWNGIFKIPHAVS